MSRSEPETVGRSQRGNDKRDAHSGRTRRQPRPAPTAATAPEGAAPTSVEPDDKATERPTAPVTAAESANELTPDAGEETFAARLRYLFAATRRRDGSRWTLNAVARATGGRVSAQQVYALYTGQSANPMLETIRALAEVFGVEPEYFVQAGALHRIQTRHEAEYATLEADPHIAFVSRRMGNLSAADKALIVDFVRRLGGAIQQPPPQEQRHVASDPYDRQARQNLQGAGDVMDAHVADTEQELRRDLPDGQSG